jgi:hypothetical protein
MHEPLDVDSTRPFIWLVVVDLTDLNIVTSDVSDGATLPDDIGQYTGNPQYFL